MAIAQSVQYQVSQADKIVIVQSVKYHIIVVPCACCATCASSSTCQRAVLPMASARVSAAVPPAPASPVSCRLLQWPGRRRSRVPYKNETLEMPHQRVDFANAGDKVDLNATSLDNDRKNGQTEIGELRFLTSESGDEQISLHCGLKEGVEALRFFTSESGNEQISIKQYVDRMKVGQRNIYYAKGRDFIDVEGCLCVEMARMQGGEVLYVLDPAAKKAVEQLKEFDGKKLMSVLGEEECGDDDDAGDELVEYEQQSEWGDSGYSEDEVRRELCEIQAAEEEEDDDDEYMDEADDDDGD